MSARLGEMLLKVGTLTEDQLEQVLNAQSIYGGRLGTNLVEMGLVEEEELARLLSEQLGVPCAHPSELSSIPESLLKMFPLELVQRYRVLPLALDGKRLTVAMTNPSDFKALEDIAFVTGMIIIPRVCSELRLSIALERIFGVKRPMRYIPVEGGARSRFAATLAERGSADPAWDGGAVCHTSERVSLEDLSERLAKAVGESEVVQAVLSYLAGEFDRGAFLRLKGGCVHGVQAVEAGSPVKGFPFFAAAMADTRQLKRVVEERRLFLGELEPDQGEGLLLRAMGGKVPGSALLVPVALGGQVVGVICASDQRGRLGGGVFELQRVAVMAELSFEMLSLKKRIMTV
uniref:General secretory system II protein E domain protein n=1 Tax=Geobacter sp. (strain M21) TaxID=443144 RepID=C6E8N7_GEOSM